MGLVVIREPVVELCGLYGSDETHALSAWTSTSRELTEKKLARMPKLLHELAKNGHGTPFEKSMLHFHVITDIATHIHLLKHRIGVSINAESARYKEFRTDRLYIPPDWPDELVERLQRHGAEAFRLYHGAVASLPDRKRAKESARFFLPYCTAIEADISFNFRSFVHFLKLRMAPDAQREVCEVARRMLALVAEDGRFRHSLAAYGLLDREHGGIDP
jgi:flavin-dependent thymidylate synthase